MSGEIIELPIIRASSIKSCSRNSDSEPPHKPRLRTPATHTDIKQDTALGNDTTDERSAGQRPDVLDDDSIQPPSDWSEITNVPRRNLGFMQILSLIVNSVVGTGIFTQPGFVLALTKSKLIALALWAAGGVYTAVTLFVFLEYGTALPFNGGPMVYLMVLIIFSFHRILLGSSASNCRRLAINLITLANAGVPSDTAEGLIQLVAVIIIAVVCLLIYFLRPLCFILNSSFAMFKLTLLVVLAVAGLVLLRGKYSGVPDFNHKHPGFDANETATGMIYVIFSYQGFINVNCIAGEIKEIKRNLRYAGIISILLITMLYLFIVVVFYVVLDYESLTSKEGRDDVAGVFAKKVFGTETGMRVAVSLSAFATLIFQVYTLARVKQAIAWRRIIPFYKFFGRQDPQFDSPGGGLVLHGVFTAIPLLALSNSRSDVRNFALGVYSWGHELIMVFLGLGLLRLKQRMQLIWPNWTFTYFTNRFILYFIVFVFAASNAAILVMTSLPHSPGEIPSWRWSITVAVVICAALVYWGTLRLLMVPWGKGKITLGSIIGFEFHIYESNADNHPDDVRLLMREARHGGMSRLVKYKISGPTKAMYDGYQKALRFISQSLS